METKNKIICLDCETTGLFVGDDILQLSIIDGDYNVLFNEYFRPEVDEWPEAQAVNHITPEMVADKPPIQHWLPKLNEILSQADVIVGYNLPFDLEFLSRAGVSIDCDKQYFDVMLEFAPIYGEYSEYYEDYKWQKLRTCAYYYGYRPNGSLHDSLEDAKATLFCYYAMNRSVERG